ncbi:reverse transcriptase [Penicillium chrysogenum]|uniref:reverse transcriptase n=1 Tax=Penicillium chrysogenum TaxID=5076 RepID=UPI0024DF26CA|nr:reverse transcriptase [Penicillium chrysogenum]KAJ5244721.1 reverse transcriptase [Penicillium chrysogenum]
MQIDGLNAPTPTRSWAAIAAGTDKPQPLENRRQADTDRGCAKPLHTEDKGNASRRYLPARAANAHTGTAVEGAIYPACIICGDQNCQGRSHFRLTRERRL